MIWKEVTPAHSIPVTTEGSGQLQLLEMAQPEVTSPTPGTLLGALHPAGINSQDFITSMFAKGRRAGTGNGDQAVPQVSCLYCLILT